VTTQTLSLTFIQLSRSSSSGPPASGRRSGRLNPALFDQLHVLGFGWLARRRLMAVIAERAVGDLLHRVLRQAHRAQPLGDAEPRIERGDGVGHARRIGLARPQAPARAPPSAPPRGPPAR